MSVHLDLKELLGTDYDGADFSDRIVNQAAQILADGMSSDIRDTIKKTGERIATERIQSIVDGIFETPFVATDNYGTQRKDAFAKTPLEMIMDSANAYLKARVNGSGNPARYGDKDMSRLEWLAGKHADELVKESLAPEMKKVAEEFKQTIGGKLSTIFRDALTQAMK